MPDFNPALPLPIKWNISDDRFDPEKQVLSLTIPVDSVTHLIDHLQNLVNLKAKDGEVYDFNKKEKVKTKCVQIYSKAVDGPYGIFGNINPQKIESVNEELPFKPKNEYLVKDPNLNIHFRIINGVRYWLTPPPFDYKK